MDFSEKKTDNISITSSICPACDCHMLSVIFTLIYISPVIKDYLTGSGSYCMDYKFNLWSYKGKKLQTMFLLLESVNSTKQKKILKELNDGISDISEKLFRFADRIDQKLQFSDVPFLSRSSQEVFWSLYIYHSMNLRHKTNFLRICLTSISLCCSNGVLIILICMMRLNVSYRSSRMLFISIQETLSKRRSNKSCIEQMRFSLNPTISLPVSNLGLVLSAPWFYKNVEK